MRPRGQAACGRLFAGLSVPTAAFVSFAAPLPRGDAPSQPRLRPLRPVFFCRNQSFLTPKTALPGRFGRSAAALAAQRGRPLFGAHPCPSAASTLRFLPRLRTICENCDRNSYLFRQFFLLYYTHIAEAYTIVSFVSVRRPAGGTHGTAPPQQLLHTAAHRRRDLR